MRSDFPGFIQPMMASLVKEPFNHRDWVFETKLDGHRTIAAIDSEDSDLVPQPVAARIEVPDGPRGGQ
jgi:ATP-dependent DNA ligase